MTYLNWYFYGDDKQPMGYSYVARMMKNGLRQAGCNIDSPAKNIIIHSIPWDKFSWYENQRAGIFTMWEHGKVPMGFRTGMQPFDFCVTPSFHCKEQFEEFFDRPIYVVPHGIDPEVYYPTLKPRKRRKGEPFRILASATNLRKGFPEVVKAFQLADLPNAELVLKGPHERTMREWPRGLPDGVSIVSTKLPEDQLRELYQSADLYISGSRGEGWDLIAFEAAACGVPTIVPAHTGYNNWNFLCNRRIENWHEEESKVKMFGDAGNWNVMNASEIAMHICDIYNDHPREVQKARESALKISKFYTWKDAARSLLDQIGAEHLKPLKALGAKVDKDILIRCRAVKDLSSYDIGGMRAGPIKTGAEYSLPSEVARVLSEGGFVEQLGPARA